MTSLLQHHAAAASPEREAEILALGPWFHNLHLPDGAQTAPASPLGDFPAFKWREIAPYIPEDLAGWTALDVGCNAGFYTFELARRGARVVGIDVEPLFLRQAAWAAREFALADRVEFRRMAVYDLARAEERFDLVLFMGVLYHLRYPMLGLDAVTGTVGRLMIFQTLTAPGLEVHADTARDRGVFDRADLAAPGWPRVSFLEHRFAGDETNWWAPNHAAVEAMLRSSGMRVTARPGHELYVCEPDPSAEPWPRGRGRPEFLAATGRAWQDAADHRDAPAAAAVSADAAARAAAARRRGP